MLSLPVAIQRGVGVDREPRVVVLDVPGARNEIGIAIRLPELGGDVGELRTCQVGAGERVPQAVPRRPLLARAVSEESCCHVDVHPRRHDPVHHTRVQIVVTVRPVLIRKEGRIVERRAIRLDVRQGHRAFRALEDARELGAQIRLELGAHVDVRVVLFVARRERVGHVVLRERDGPLLIVDLRDEPGEEPHPVAHDRATEAQDRLVVLEVSRRGGHVLRDPLVDRVQSQRRPRVTHHVFRSIVDSRAAMVSVATALGDGADDASRRGTVLRVVAALLDLNLLDEIRPHFSGSRPRPPGRHARPNRRRVHAVDDVTVLGAAGAIDHDAAAARFVTGTWGVCDDAREIAALGNAVDDFLRDAQARRVLFDVDQR